MTNDTDQPTQDSVAARLASLTANIGSVRAMVAEGQILEIDGLAEAVETVCGDIGRLAPEARQALKAGLVTLIDEFDHLAAALRKQHGAIGGALKATRDRGRATAAYGKAGGKR